MKNLKIDTVDLGALVLIIFCAPIFFYKLGQSSLVSFDEAWYGEIARNVLKSGDLFNLTWNGSPYIDHPPASFWLIGLSEAIIGDNELGVRFAPAFLGLLSMVVVYLLGKDLFSRSVGLAAALALPSSFWFLFRARSGNLDIILTFFFLLTLYLAFKASKEKIYLLPLSAAMSFLLLTKTLVPLTILPSLIIIFWRTKYSWKDFFKPLFILIILVSSWFVVNLINQPGFINHYFSIGLPGVKAETNYLENFRLINEYLHNGVGKWFWPGVLAVFLGLISRQKSFYILSIFFLTFFIPFIFSAKGHIWHLIPLHPILILTFFGMAYVVLKRFIKQELVVLVLFLCLVGLISFLQTRRSFYEFIDVSRFISDEAILSSEAGKYPYDFYIDGDFLPAAIFYSEKNVEQIGRDKLSGLFKDKNPVLIITYQWQLDGLGIKEDQYKVLKTDRDKILILIQQ